MKSPVHDPCIWGPEDRQISLVARNVTTRYLAIGIDGVIGLLLLPFNVSYLGQSAYGLWALTASITMYFSVLDLGYAGALVKFVAQYRAWRDRQALNEILSTMFVVFTTVGLAALAATALIAAQFGRLFNVTAEQVATGQRLLLIIGSYIAIRFGVGIFGAVGFGFQRYYLNNGIGIATSIAAAVVNVVVLRAGFDLVALVAATTLVRIIALGGFVWTAYRVYPGLQVRLRLFRRARLKEVTGFSVYILVLDWAARLNYTTDTLVIGALLSTSAVAVWTVGQRLAEVCQRLTNQLSGSIFPVVVDSDAAQRVDRLRLVFVQGTRLSLALAVPVCFGLAVMAKPVITAWVGRDYGGSVIVTQVLLAVVVIRVGMGSANALLRGAGGHRLLAFTNAGTAIVNIALSVALIRPFGLVGVAVATLVPVTCAAVFVLFPAACRRVGLGAGVVLRQALIPALWPVMAPAAILWLGYPFAGRLSAVAGLLILAGLAYELLFFGLALSGPERRFYWTKLGDLIGRRRRIRGGTSTSDSGREGDVMPARAAQTPTADRGLRRAGMHSAG